MQHSLLEPNALDYTRATAQESPIGASLWTQGTTVQDYQLPPESDEPDAGSRISGVFASGVATPIIQIVFSPEGQDISVRAPQGADLPDRVRNQLAHGAVEDVPNRTSDLIRRLVERLCAYHSRFDSAEFRRTLVAQLYDEPIEDAVAHPAEGWIRKALERDSSGCLQALSEALRNSYVDRASLAASILRCIGRMSYGQVGRWGLRVADDALRHQDVEVREAAVRALEAWGCREGLAMLRSHHDVEAWLDDYVRQVVSDLSDTTR
jgi:hypothetical protein